ncbi:uncharacterized protein LOC143183298 [Calliopsis andreniformis]|uniref:uncharacterized protein LOC143183298 n=1 Tax=Calliopsis andreniformis TaxID=337506 RepID=UPI003FCD244E
MIVATHKCGCPPKEEKPPCSPCCASRKKVSITTPTYTDSEGPCFKKSRLRSILSTPKIEEPQCCPTEPDTSSELDSRKIRSEIAEKGLPYKELEAVFNDNRLVIRTQKEPPRPEYDPPCDCDEDSRPPAEDEEQDQAQSSGNRTVTLFPRPRSPPSRKDDKDSKEEKQAKLIEREENPNIFLLKVKRKGRDGNNIDLEFKAPRPWSLKKRMEFCELVQTPQIVEPPPECADVPVKIKPQKRSRSRRRNKRKKK